MSHQRRCRKDMNDFSLRQTRVEIVPNPPAGQSCKRYKAWGDTVTVCHPIEEPKLVPIPQKESPSLWNKLTCAASCVWNHWAFSSYIPDDGFCRCVKDGKHVAQ